MADIHYDPGPVDEKVVIDLCISSKQPQSTYASRLPSVNSTFSSARMGKRAAEAEEERVAEVRKVTRRARADAKSWRKTVGLEPEKHTQAPSPHTPASSSRITPHLTRPHWSPAHSNPPPLHSHTATVALQASAQFTTVCIPISTQSRLIPPEPALATLSLSDTIQC